MNRSIEGFENQTLYSGGGATWSGTLKVKEGEAATTARWVTFAIPDIGGNVEVSVKVDYVWTQTLGALHQNIDEEDVVPIRLRIERK